jgi:hypothetical protein
MMLNHRYFVGKEPNGNPLAGTVDVMVARLPLDIDHDDEAAVAKALLELRYPAGLIGMNLPAIMGEIKRRSTRNVERK